ncbi:NADPH-dependent FMN reductase [Erysipelothrix urinaevulpis]|uniref:NADPH-dependent FMN reductase n=1 Tax=Erysipelothrix urinaevulpis TaxID=2683717 RepID=UPI00135C5FD2|nr:NADPH-dependent FMN reductase [Erysipelothrix urinaevulpis]
MKILGIVGSVFGSKTRIALENITFSQDVDYEIIDLATLDIMFADGRDYRDYEGDTKTLVEKILDADALIIGTPVFQASIPGALKNVFDLLPIDSIKDKVVGIVATAGSARHYLVPEYHLKPILAYMKVALLDKYVFIDSRDFLKEAIIEDDVHFRLRNLARQVENRVTQIKKEYEERYDF